MSSFFKSRSTKSSGKTILHITFEKLLADNFDLKEKINQLRKILTRAREEVKHVRSQSAALAQENGTIPVLREELAHAREELAQAQEKLEEGKILEQFHQTALSKNNHNGNLLEKALKEIRRLENQIRTVIEEEQPALRQEVATLQASKRELELENNQLQKKCMDSSASYEDLNSQLREAKKDMERLREVQKSERPW